MTTDVLMFPARSKSRNAVQRRLDEGYIAEICEAKARLRAFCVRDCFTHTAYLLHLSCCCVLFIYYTVRLIPVFVSATGPRFYLDKTQLASTRCHFTLESFWSRIVLDCDFGADSCQSLESIRAHQNLAKAACSGREGTISLHYK